jgi:RecB family exonuclease
LPGHAELAALAPDALDERISAAVAVALRKFTRRYQLILSSAGRLLEQRRTERILLRWLALERGRRDFQVIGQEQDIRLELGGLELRGKIDRLDRLEDGSTLLIDYKTGRTGKQDWFPEPRIADPQMPAYAIALSPPPAAIAFARIRPEDLRFDGICADDAGTQGITSLAATGHRFKSLTSWDELVAGWQTHLESLARDFRLGRATVDPRKPDVCKRCHLQALCRIAERSPRIADDGDD